MRKNKIKKVLKEGMYIKKGVLNKNFFTHNHKMTEKEFINMFRNVMITRGSKKHKNLLALDRKSLVFKDNYESKIQTNEAYFFKGFGEILKREIGILDYISYINEYDYIKETKLLKTLLPIIYKTETESFSLIKRSSIDEIESLFVLLISEFKQDFSIYVSKQILENIWIRELKKENLIY